MPSNAEFSFLGEAVIEVTAGGERLRMEASSVDLEVTQETMDHYSSHGGARVHDYQVMLDRGVVLRCSGVVSMERHDCGAAPVGSSNVARSDMVRVIRFWREGAE